VSKCVTNGKTDDKAFSNAARILDLAISKACQDLCVALQASELEKCHKRIGRLTQMRNGNDTTANDRQPGPTNDVRLTCAAASGSLVDRALEYIARHHLEPHVTLAVMAGVLGVTEKHLTAVFTRAVGQRMHAYLVQLRIQHACRLIMLTEKSVKQIAYESGFKQVDTFRRSFHRYVGVAPGAYRDAFGHG
jgi:AraC-like DNA-binding protein